MMVNIGDVFARICNSGIPDEEAEAMLETAALQAAEQVRTQGRQLRKSEFTVMAHQKERGERQHQNAANERHRLKQEKVHAERRQAELVEAERINGPRRGRW